MFNLFNTICVNCSPLTKIPANKTAIICKRCQRKGYQLQRFHCQDTGKNIIVVCLNKFK